MAKKEKYVMICPKCKSPDVYMDQSNPLQPAMGLPAVYICNKCKQSGNYFPEIKLSDLEDFENEVNGTQTTEINKNEVPKIDTSYGNFTVNVFWKISAPVALVLGILGLFRNLTFGITLITMGIIMFYFTYFKKRKLKT